MLTKLCLHVTFKLRCFVSIGQIDYCGYLKEKTWMLKSNDYVFEIIYNFLNIFKFCRKS